MIEPTFSAPADVLAWIRAAGEHLINLRVFTIAVTCIAWAFVGALIADEPYYSGDDLAVYRHRRLVRWFLFFLALSIGCVGAALMLKGTA